VKLKGAAKMTDLPMGDNETVCRISNKIIHLLNGECVSVSIGLAAVGSVQWEVCRVMIFGGDHYTAAPWLSNHYKEVAEDYLRMEGKEDD
jgi:hypothetical protein